jgi:hypothetical protein
MYNRSSLDKLKSYRKSIFFFIQILLYKLKWKLLSVTTDNVNIQFMCFWQSLKSLFISNVTYTLDSAIVFVWCM